MFLDLFLWRAKVELVGLVGDGVLVLKKPEGGKKMHSVLKDFSCENFPSKAKLG